MPAEGLTVAVTGPTGDLGIAVVSALERSRSVRRVVGMARRPFDPAEHGWRKTEYHQGDVQDHGSVRDLVKEADVVVHLAFAIVSAGEATRELNVGGSRRVFEESAKAGVRRLCYASSVAAYGFHEDNPTWLTEDVPARGTPEHFYSQQKAEVEQVLSQVLMKQDSTTIGPVVEAFGLSPEERQFLLAAGKGEGLFFARGSHLALQVEASPAEHRLATTAPRELAEQVVRSSPATANRLDQRPPRSGQPGRILTPVSVSGNVP